MCPICRYELETDDANYEKERKARMKKRKLRLRRDELDRKTIAKLKELMSDLGVSFVGCIDKRELVDRLVQSGKIDIVDGVAQVEILKSEMLKKSVGDLKQMLLSFGISAEGALYKSELVDRLVESQRILIIEDEELDNSEKGERMSCDYVHSESKNYGANDFLESCPAYTEVKSSLNNHSAPDENDFGFPSGMNPEEKNDSRIRLSKSFLATLSISEIKLMMRDADVCASNCIERKDLIDRLASHPNFHVSDD